MKSDIPNVLDFKICAVQIDFPYSFALTMLGPRALVRRKYAVNLSSLVKWGPESPLNPYLI